MNLCYRTIQESECHLVGRRSMIGGSISELRSERNAEPLNVKSIIYLNYYTKWLQYCDLVKISHSCRIHGCFT